MLNLFQNPFVKYFVCMGLRVKPSCVRKKCKTLIISDKNKASQRRHFINRE